jgi:hypothetical protein
MDFLRQQAAANDPATEGRRGVDIVLRLNQIGGTPVQPSSASLAPLPGAATSDDEDEGDEPSVAPTPVMVAPAPPTIAPTDARITITLNQIPLGEALRYIASQPDSSKGRAVRRLDHSRQ